jgi:hypothetical protein
MKLAALTLLFLFMVTFAHPVVSVKSPALNQSFDLKVGQTVSVQDTPLKVSFQSVAKDSRCPEDVTCVWAGNATVVLKISEGGRPATTINLNSGLNPKHISYQGYDIKLADVKPRRNTHRQISQSDYVITLTVTKI